MPPAAPSGASRRLILTVAISAIVLETSLLGVVAPLLPEIEERTGAGDATLGLAIAAYAIPTLLASVPFASPIRSGGGRFCSVASS